MIEVKNLQKHYGILHVLKDIDLHISEGEMVAITGSSGAGKTTLLHILSTFETPSNKKECLLVLNKKEIKSLTKKQLASFRNEEIGFIFQFHNLLHELTALENIMLPAIVGKKDLQKTKQYAFELMDYLGINSKSNNLPLSLSGGEQQRVAIARALINRPKIIFADEPTGNLDSKNTKHLSELFLNLKKDFNSTLLLVTHDEQFAQQADRKLTMVDGSFIN